ncbi:glucan endo-1,3-beta-glucosidase 12-like isoform X2 [Salvia splendens]|uniref:glucan endo-1,3-beta-glucosidase 12-like isoform X2 n=1 Tax=Salvia splendens TaxID=180675 RepID=UPI001C254E53|nr:glucan endo-1,3-beta-glucosidase 12-like isoform X2 [Salvia splendens]
MGTFTLWAFLSILIIQCFQGSLLARTIIVQEKFDASIPITSLSPQEGNTTFLAGTNWCVARPGVPQADLKIALDWACGLGKADCRAIQAEGTCFEPGYGRCSFSSSESLRASSASSFKYKPQSIWREIDVVIMLLLYLSTK